MQLKTQQYIKPLTVRVQYESVTTNRERGEEHYNIYYYEQVPILFVIHSEHIEQTDYLFST